MSERVSRILPYATLAIACALVLLLGQQKRTLTEEVSRLRTQYRQARFEPLPGMFLPEFNTATLEGEPVTIGALPAQGRQVLFVYTTTCRYCLSTLPVWKKLATTLDTLSAVPVQVYGVSNDSVGVTRQYEAKHALPYRTVQFPSDKVRYMYRADAVPLTLVLDEQGRTIYSRLGEITQQATADSVIAAVKWKPTPRPAAARQPAPAASR